MKPLVLLLAAAACLLPPDDDLDGLPINHLQVIGSHNSYKRAIDPALFAMLTKRDTVRFKELEYSHLDLSAQLDLGLRALEIDVYADAKGGKYARPKGLDMAKDQAPYDPTGVMQQPGFKVLHVQDIDFRSNCLTFSLCLAELKRWSAANPQHTPVYVTMNAKDDAINSPLGFTVPDKFTPEIFDALDQTIVDNLGRDRLITPDQVRGKYATLEAAVLAGNWPLLKNARGKFLFVLDETGPKRAAYLRDHPSLRGRVLFADAPPGTPEAAFLIRNNAKTDSIAILVAKGYLVRTRADAGTKEARANDKSSFEAACRSGAQIISTDYYRPSAHFNSPYVVAFDGGTYLRANPLFGK